MAVIKKSTSRIENAKHYDLGNKFYSLWLDETLTYSSGIFKDTNATLKEAQLAKYDRIIEKLDIKSSDHILEIGCGWGGFFTRAVELTGCRVTGVTISKEQADYANQVIIRNKLQANVEIKEIDYRKIEDQYDKIVSIEMIEAVGMEYWDTYFKKIRSCLKDNGKALIQGITIQESLFEAYSTGTDFIQQYVFPGGMLITDKIMEAQAVANQMRVVENFQFGLDYAKTLKIWKANFTSQLSDVQDQGFDSKFIRMWGLYLSYCEGAFRAERINVSQFLIQA